MAHESNRREQPAVGARPAPTLVGVSALFMPDELECLVRTAAEAVYGDADDLSVRQLDMAARARHLMDLEAGDGEPPAVSGAAVLAASLRALAVQGQVGVDLYADHFEVVGPDDVSLYAARCHVTAADLAALLGIPEHVIHDAR
ncbi:hypothetical protein ACFY2H_31595 [Streptomyces griseofuscus]|uniref:hypothetical protein n=1 Tax=Streptomyces griseofuscus TaxID=146922 RepID=UPI003678DB93